MQKWISSTIILICTHNILTGQLCIEDRFTQAGFFSTDEITLENNISYGMANTWYYDIEVPELNMFNIAYPNIDIDPLNKRPLVILAHGGGFWGGEKENMDYIIQHLAQKGFVAATINYRKGWDAYGDPENCDGDGVSMYQAIYKAMQDVQAAVRYIVTNADEYGIDTSWIFLGGQSAGVYAMMNSTYATQEEWNVLFPDHNYLFGDINNATNDLVADFTVKGFLNFWGGIVDLNLIDADEAVPTINFYGTEDNVVPPYQGNFQGCDDYAYVYGSASIYEALNVFGVCNVVHAREGYGHDTYEDDYVIDNVTCFMKSLFCDDCSSYEVNYQTGSCEELGATEITMPSIEEFTVYPNPANTFVVINSVNPFQLNFKLNVWNSIGQSINIDYNQNGNSLVLQTSKLPSGIYYFSLNNNNKINPGSFLIDK